MLKNLTDAIYKILQKHQAAIEKMLVDEREPSAEQQECAYSVPLSIESMPDGHSSAADISRQTRVKEAHKLHQVGWTNKAIALELGVCSKAVGRYLNMELPLSPLRKSGRKQLLDPLKLYIIERWNAGCHNAAQLYREIQAQSFSGRITVVRDFCQSVAESERHAATNTQCLWSKANEKKNSSTDLPMSLVRVLGGGVSPGRAWAAHLHLITCLGKHNGRAPDRRGTDYCGRGVVCRWPPART